MTSCAINVLTANSSAICAKRALSWKAGASNITSVVRIVRLATAPRASMPGTGRTGLMGAARPQTPRRSPRQAFGGNKGSKPQDGKQTKTKILTNPQNFSYEVSHLRVMAMAAPLRYAAMHPLSFGPSSFSVFRRRPSVSFRVIPQALGCKHAHVGHPGEHPALPVPSARSFPCATRLGRRAAS